MPPQPRLLRLRRLALGAAALASASLGPEVPVARAAPAAAWSYDVTVSPGLDRVSVRLCFGTMRPKRLILVSGGETGHVKPAAGEPRAGGFDPATRSWAVDVPVEGACVSYEAELLPPSRGIGRGRSPGAVVTEAGSWLLRPAGPPEGAHATLRFRLPAGVGASTPWARDPSVPEGYVLDPTTWAFIGHVAFGAIVEDAFDAAGSSFRVSVLPGETAAGVAGIRAWLGAAASAVADVFGGRFPRDRVQAIVRPVPAGSAHGHDPVPFGSSWQGGGPALVLLLSEDARAEELPGEWVAVHEMVHLAMPVIDPADAWLSEGFATYYQEVLRARAGRRAPRDAWQELEAGFGRGRRSGGERSLAEESRAMRETHEFHRVYWAGAALALLLDVELRRFSGGRLSLDDAMRHLAKDLGSPRSLSGADVVARVDAWAGRPVFSSIATPALASASFPPVETAYAWLGVVVDDGTVSLRDDAPGALHRRALETRREPGAEPAPSRSQ
jgi:hypothetical protein